MDVPRVSVTFTGSRTRFADTAIFVWVSTPAGERSMARGGEKLRMLRKSKKGARNKCPLTRFCLRELGVRITRKLSREARRDREVTSATRRSYVHLRSEFEEKLQAESKADGQPTKQCDQRHRACCLRQFFGYRDRGGRDRRRSYVRGDGRS